MTSVQHVSVVGVSLPPRSFLHCRIVSQLHPSPISPYPRLKMCISLQSRSHLNPIQALRFTFHLCLRWILPQSGPWYLHLTYIHVTSHLHPAPPNCILVPSKQHLKTIQVSRCVSHLHPGPFSTGELYLSSIPVPYHPIHVSRCASQLNPGPSQPHPGLEICVSSPPRLPDSRFLVVSVESYLNLGPDIYISPPSSQHLTSIQLNQITS